MTAAPAQLLALQDVLDDVADLIQVRHRSGPPLPGFGGGSGPDPVDGAAAGDRQYPRFGVALGGVVAERYQPDFQQNLLGDLLGLRRIAEHRPDDGVDRSGQLLVDQVVSALVPSCRGLEQHVQAVRAWPSGIRRGSQESTASQVRQFVSLITP
jgi:hypothetical protein